MTAATLKISLWTHLLKFLCSPTQEKLVVLQLLHVRLLVETTDAALAKPTSLHGQTSQSPSFLQTLDTNTALLDIRHPMWTKVRSWIPRLLFLCRCVHVMEVEIGDISVDVVRKDKVAMTPVLSIQVACFVWKCMCNIEKLTRLLFDIAWKRVCECDVSREI